MRIAFFSDTYLPSVNGVSCSIDVFSKLLSEKHQVRIYVPAYGWRETVEKRGGLEIYRFRSFAWPTYKDLHFSLPNVMEVLNNAEKFKPDLVHTHTPFSLGLTGILVAKRLGIPIVGTYHTLYSETLEYISVRRVLSKYLTGIEKIINGVGVQLAFENGKKHTEDDLSKKLTWQIVNRIYSLCDLVICPSSSIRQELEKRGFHKPMKVVSNGIDTKLFTPRAQIIQDKNSCLVLYVGRLGFEKNVDDVLRVFSLVSDRIEEARLWVVGDGPARRGLMDLSRELGIEKKVSWLGMVERSKLPKIYSRGKLLVTTSAMETQGLTVLEAMACGLPVVGVRAYALPDLIKNDKNGYLSRPGDVYGMSKMVMKILTDEELRQRLGKHSIILAGKHEIRKIIGEIDTIYNSLIDGSV